MKRITVFFALLLSVLLPTVLNAQLQNHPRLLITSDSIPAIKARLVYQNLNNLYSRHDYTRLAKIQLESIIEGTDVK